LLCKLLVPILFFFPLSFFAPLSVAFALVASQQQMSLSLQQAVSFVEEGGGAFFVGYAQQVKGKCLEADQKLPSEEVLIVGKKPQMIGLPPQVQRRLENGHTAAAAGVGGTTSVIARSGGDALQMRDHVQSRGMLQQHQQQQQQGVPQNQETQEEEEEEDEEDEDEEQQQEEEGKSYLRWKQPPVALKLPATTLSLSEMRKGLDSEDKKNNSVNDTSWIDEIPMCPVFYPTKEEFEDPLTYIRSIAPIAQPYGMNLSLNLERVVGWSSVPKGKRKKLHASLSLSLSLSGLECVFGGDHNSHVCCGKRECKKSE
jgi:hypothetical protein